MPDATLFPGIPGSRDEVDHDHVSARAARWSRRAVAAATLVLAVGLLPVAGASAEPASAAAADIAAPTPVVSGNVMVDSRTGAAFVPRGVNWPSFEYACAQGWGYSRDTATAHTAAAIAAWKANTVRVPLNQDCWLGTNGSPVSDQWEQRTAAGYRAAVAAFVADLNSAGLVVILDLHTFSTPTSDAFGQRAMPDAASLTFWSQVAAAYKSNHSVIFDAYNEPYSRWNDSTGQWAFQLTWDCWQSGGCHPPVADDNSPVTAVTYQATGMTQIVSAIRTAGATQPVMLPGIDYANDLRGWLAHRPDDSQLVASFHNYDSQRCGNAACWNAEIAPVAAVVPVVTGEFGADSGATFVNSYMAWADTHGVGYLAWAWWVEPDLSLALLTDDNGTPRAPLGTALKAHLATVGQPAPPAAGTFVAIPARRLIDTRTSGGPVPPGGVVGVPVTGAETAPAGASAAVLNVTVVGPVGAGYVTAYASGTTRPGTSNFNFTPGQTVASLVTVPVGSDGKVLLYNGSGGRSHIVADLLGYYRPGGATVPGAFRTVTPTRLLDTRTGSGTHHSRSGEPRIGGGRADSRPTGRTRSFHVGRHSHRHGHGVNGRRLRHRVLGYPARDLQLELRDQPDSGEPGDGPGRGGRKGAAVQRIFR